jgi:YegS/Rv2252/BmrU family lipid kinase
VIINPSSGRGRGAAAGRRTLARLKEKGRAFDSISTKEPGHARELAQRFFEAEENGLLLAVGGDGTIHEVAQAMGANPLRGCLAFIPAGSGDDAARTIGIPRKLETAVDAAIGDKEKILDLGLFGGEFFFNGVGIGLDGESAARVRSFRRLRGFPAYLAAALATLAHYENPRIRIGVGGETVWDGSALLCAVGNGPSCGGGFLLTPDADPADGELDLCVLGDFGRLEALLNLPLALSGGHRHHPKARFFRGTRFSLEANIPLFAHADGEIRRPEFPVEYSIVPRAIRVKTA